MRQQETRVTALADERTHAAGRNFQLSHFLNINAATGSFPEIRGSARYTTGKQIPDQPYPGR